MEKIVSKKQAIKEAGWLRKKLNEWESERRGDYYYLDSSEKGRFINRLERLECFVERC